MSDAAPASGTSEAAGAARRPPRTPRRPHHPVHHYAIWRDRNGRFSPLKAATLVLGVLPALYIAWSWAQDGLGPRPVTEAIHETGLWCVRFLLLCLLVSPARALFNWHRVMLLRRLLGNIALCYGAAHIVLYARDEAWSLPKVASEILLRFYLEVGFVALVGLAVLGATSSDRAMRALGHGWKRLHRTVYPIAALGIFHYFLQAKAEVAEPTLVAGLFVWLMAWRLLPAGPDRQPLPVAAVALLAAAATIVIEYGWFALATSINPMRPLRAEFDVAYGPHPAVQVLVVAACMSLAVTLHWLHQRERFRSRAWYGPALYVGGAVIANALLWTFLPDSFDEQAGPVPGPLIGAVWVALFALLGLARNRLDGRRRTLLDALAVTCLLYPVYTVGLSNMTAALAANVVIALAALALAGWTWPVSRTAALLLLPTCAWIAFATSTLV